MSLLWIFCVYLVGVGLLVADLFIGSMALGVVGIVAIAGAIFGAFVEGGPLVGGGLVLSTSIVTWVVAKIGLKRLTNKDELAAEAGYIAGPVAGDLVGQAGVAETMLRPGGFARLGGKRVDVVTRGELVEAGTPVEVVQVEGARVVVRAQGKA